MVVVLKLPVSKQVEKAFLKVLKRVGLPWEASKRGRKPKNSPLDYALVLFARAYHGFSYRTSELILGIPKSTIFWAFQKLTAQWVEALIAASSKCLAQFLNPDAQIIDSTGISLSANGFKRKLEYDAYVKLHVLVAYCRKRKAVWFVKTKVTSKRVHDIKPGMEFLLETPLSAILLADKGYDAKELYRLAFKRGLAVCMRQRKNCESRKGPRGKVYKTYDDEFYRATRGRVESVFGGFANRYGSRVREKSFRTQSIQCTLWAAAHNFRTLEKVLINLSIYWTVSPKISI